eukprot:4702491-Amphidinium_carterae.1
MKVPRATPSPGMTAHIALVSPTPKGIRRGQQLRRQKMQQRPGLSGRPMPLNKYVAPPAAALALWNHAWGQHSFLTLR